MQWTERLAPHAHWGIRLSVAATFLYHGLGKYPIPAFAEAYGLPVWLTWAVAIAEVAAAVCLLTGAFGRELLTRLAGLIIVGVAAGAIALVHAPNGFSFTNNGFEFQLLLVMCGFWFFARGNGT